MCLARVWSETVPMAFARIVRREGAFVRIAGVRQTDECFRDGPMEPLGLEPGEVADDLAGDDEAGHGRDERDGAGHAAVA